jgi:hypothetical protein
MSRLGIWEPTTIEERLDRFESIANLRQLLYRYALAIDSRDIDTLVELFVPDVRVGRDLQGRDALHSWFTQLFHGFRTSVHFVGNHILDFDDADHAHGIVYCRDEVERPDSGEWEVGMLQYWDNYVRVDGEWCFARRKFHRWYLVDALTRPGHGAGVNVGRDALGATLLPDAFPTWAPFWDKGIDG